MLSSVSGELFREATVPATISITEITAMMRLTYTPLSWVVPGAPLLSGDSGAYGCFRSRIAGRPAG